MNQKSKQQYTGIVYTGLFSAFVTVATMIAVPAGTGYVNAGDIALLIGAFTLSPVQAMLAAGIGSCIADLINGYAVYIPATFIIKALMALAAHFLLRLLKKISAKEVLSVMLSSVFAELIMALGYLSYEWSILGYGAAALGSIPANLIQGFFGAAGGAVLYFVLKHTKLKDKLYAI